MSVESMSMMVLRRRRGSMFRVLNKLERKMRAKTGAQQ